MEKHIHIPIEGLPGAHITFLGSEKPDPKTVLALERMAKFAFEKFKLTDQQYEELICQHQWKRSHSGYQIKCKKCGAWATVNQNDHGTKNL